MAVCPPGLRVEINGVDVSDCIQQVDYQIKMDQRPFATLRFIDGVLITDDRTGAVVLDLTTNQLTQPDQGNT